MITTLVTPVVRRHWFVGTQTLSSAVGGLTARRISLDSLRIPILKIGDILIASIQVALHDASAVQFKDDLLQKIHDTRAKGVIVDLTALDVVDSFIGRLIADIAAMAGLMGTRVVLTGLQPAVAITLVELGLELPRVLTALNLEKGLSMMQRLTEESGDGAA
jgi:rsbT antagonist protein RsbS